MKVVVMAALSRYAGNWPLKQLKFLGRPNTFDPIQWSVGTGDGWIAVSIADDVRGDYEPEVLEKLIDGVEDPTVYLVEASREKTIARYIEAIPDVPGIMLDNTHGYIASLQLTREGAGQEQSRFECLNASPGCPGSSRYPVHRPPGHPPSSSCLGLNRANQGQSPGSAGRRPKRMRV